LLDYLVSRAITRASLRQRHSGFIGFRHAALATLLRWTPVRTGQEYGLEAQLAGEAVRCGWPVTEVYLGWKHHRRVQPDDVVERRLGLVLTQLATELVDSGDLSRAPSAPPAVSYQGPAREAWPASHLFPPALEAQLTREIEERFPDFADVYFHVLPEGPGRALAGQLPVGDAAPAPFRADDWAVATFRFISALARAQTYADRRTLVQAYIPIYAAALRTLMADTRGQTAVAVNARFDVVYAPAFAAAWAAEKETLVRAEMRETPSRLALSHGAVIAALERRFKPVLARWVGARAADRWYAVAAAPAVEEILAGFSVGPALIAFIVQAMTGSIAWTAIVFWLTFGGSRFIFQRAHGAAESSDAAAVNLAAVVIAAVAFSVAGFSPPSMTGIVTGILFAHTSVNAMRARANAAARGAAPLADIEAVAERMARRTAGDMPSRAGTAELNRLIADAWEGAAADLDGFERPAAAPPSVKEAARRAAERRDRFTRAYLAAFRRAERENAGPRPGWFRRWEGGGRVRRRVGSAA
jgi:hypothetical protein